MNLKCRLIKKNGFPLDSCILLVTMAFRQKVSQMIKINSQDFDIFCKSKMSNKMKFSQS